MLLRPELVPERACCGNRHCSIWAKRLLHAAQPEQELHRRCCSTLPAAGAVLSSTASGCDTAACAVVAGTLPDVLRNSTLMQYLDLSRNYFRGVLLPIAAHALMYRHTDCCVQQHAILPSLCSRRNCMSMLTCFEARSPTETQMRTRPSATSTALQSQQRQRLAPPCLSASADMDRQ